MAETAEAPRRRFLSTQFTLANLIQIGLLLFYIMRFGLHQEWKNDEQDKMLERHETQIREEMRLNHERDVKLGRALERSGVK